MNAPGIRRRLDNSRFQGPHILCVACGEISCVEDEAFDPEMMRRCEGAFGCYSCQEMPTLAGDIEGLANVFDFLAFWTRHRRSNLATRMRKYDPNAIREAITAAQDPILICAADPPPELVLFDLHKFKLLRAAIASRLGRLVRDLNTRAEIEALLDRETA